jgi:hypothetical protein
VQQYKAPAQTRGRAARRRSLPPWRQQGRQMGKAKVRPQSRAYGGGEDEPNGPQQPGQPCGMPGRSRPAWWRRWPAEPDRPAKGAPLTRAQGRPPTPRRGGQDEPWQARRLEQLQCAARSGRPPSQAWRAQNTADAATTRSRAGTRGRRREDARERQDLVLVVEEDAARGRSGRRRL